MKTRNMRMSHSFFLYLLWSIHTHTHTHWMIYIVSCGMDVWHTLVWARAQRHIPQLIMIHLEKAWDNTLLTFVWFMQRHYFLPLLHIIKQQHQQYHVAAKKVQFMINLFLCLCAAGDDGYTHLMRNTFTYFVSHPIRMKSEGWAFTRSRYTLYILWLQACTRLCPNWISIRPSLPGYFASTIVDFQARLATKWKHNNTENQAWPKNDLKESIYFYYLINLHHHVCN